MVAADGIGGELRVGYQRAARLGRWSVRYTAETIGEDVSELSASLFERDAYWCTQPITSVQLHLNAETWTWRRLRTVVMTAGRVTARLVGPPQ